MGTKVKAICNCEVFTNRLINFKLFLKEYIFYRNKIIYGKN